MNRLKMSLSYMIGPMDDVKDRGVAWRDDIQEFLWDLGCGVLNPCDKAIGNSATEEILMLGELERLKEQARLLELEGKHKEAIEICDTIHNFAKKELVAVDLRMVDISHFCIMYLRKDVHMCGSYNEQTHACLQRKPIIVMCEQGKYSIPNWLWGICNHNMFFSAWDEVKKYLEHVAHDEIVNDFNRWRFFDFDKVYGLNR